MGKNNQLEKREHITSKDVANHFMVSKPTVLQWIKDGMLVAYKLPSGHYGFLKEEINRFAKRYTLPIMQ